MIFRTNKYYLLILLVAFIVGGCGNSSGNYEEIESSASSESTTTTDDTTTDDTTTDDTTTTDTTAQMGGSIQGVELSLSKVVTTLAGTGSSGSANGTGTSASFNAPFRITTDGTNLYVAEEGNHLIRKIVISTGVVTTVAGTGSGGSTNGTGTSASFYTPFGITTDGTNLYVADSANHLIRKIE